MAYLGSTVTAPRTVAVIGGGWAGCAAAAALADAGVQVTLFEAGSELGGRARRVTLELDGETHRLDNGQHLLIGAYTGVAEVLRIAGVTLDHVVERQPFSLAYPDGFRMRAWALPAPWHLAAAVLGARGLSWAERWSMMAFLQRLKRAGWRVRPDRAAIQWLHDEGQSATLVDRLWRPLGIAALNTPLSEASAQILANVLRDSLGGSSEASMLWMPRHDLSALLPDAVARFVTARGGAVRAGVRVGAVAVRGDLFQLDDEDARFEAVVYAAPPAQLEGVAADLAPRLTEAIAMANAFEYEPICTVYLKYDASVSVPGGFSALLDRPTERAYGQWVFDRGTLDPANRGVLAVIVSASGPHEDHPLSALCDAVATQLSLELGLPQPRATRAIMEKRATLAARPGLRRPANATPVARFVIAGDWTESDYPSTLESAVRSGMAAARCLLQ